ncbi:hypothetical protein PR202_gb08512 [Eleusine coracana subsp. coracana]|uniref:Uncharacterized protein n=1 Tax=Eleusine coracana subsp. coracana TaxID=191504 RepID=A0AAV5EEI8_ELECO|nr:hypothetical protein PR202_gb08512 [Eleusine coracana subsp. coracana]
MQRQPRVRGRLTGLISFMPSKRTPAEVPNRSQAAQAQPSSSSTAEQCRGLRHRAISDAAAAAAKQCRRRAIGPGAAPSPQPPTNRAAGRIHIIPAENSNPRPRCRILRATNAVDKLVSKQRSRRRGAKPGGTLPSPTTNRARSSAF